MHLPDAWGYLQFVGSSSGGGDDDVEYSSGDDNRSASVVAASEVVDDPTWPAKLTAMTVYYALHHYRNESGR
jgi:hypothetical protein